MPIALEEFVEAGAILAPGTQGMPRGKVDMRRAFLGLTQLLYQLHVAPAYQEVIADFF